MRADSPLRTEVGRVPLLAPSLVLADNPYLLAIARGQVPGREYLRLFAAARCTTDISAPDGVPLASYHGNVPYVFPTSDQAIYLASGSASDVYPSGTGARSVRIHWLDLDHVEHDTDVNMSGTTHVNTGITTARRINWMRVLTFGTTGRNAGIIAAYWSDDVSVASRISFPSGGASTSHGAGSGVSDGIIRTIPAGKRDVVVGFTMRPPQIHTYIWLRHRASPTSPWIAFDHYTSDKEVEQRTYTVPFVFEAGADYYGHAYSTGLWTGAELIGWTETL